MNSQCRKQTQPKVYVDALLAEGPRGSQRGTSCSELDTDSNAYLQNITLSLLFPITKYLLSPYGVLVHAGHVKLHYFKITSLIRLTQGL